MDRRQHNSKVFRPTKGFEKIVSYQNKYTGDILNQPRDGGYVNKNASAKFKALLDVSIARYKQVEPLIRRHEGRTSCTKLVSN